MVIAAFVESVDGSENDFVEIDDISLTSFDVFLSVISNGDVDVTHFTYLDDENEHVSVRNNDELSSMISHFSDGRPVCIRLKGPLSAIVQPGVVQRAELVEQVSLDGRCMRRMGVIATGQCGTVYKTLDTKNDRIMAVKCIPLQSGLHVSKAILSEISISRQCSTSPYVVEFYGALSIESDLCLCMEWMNGGSMDRFGALPSNVLAPVAVSVISGLLYLWRQNVMHRDIKPSNILVNSIGQVKISDFGVSKQLERSVTRSYVGTNAYMAPERLYGGPYSLGVSLLEMALGRFPFAKDGENVNQMVQRIAKDEIPRFDDLTMNFGEPFQSLIQACIAHQPEQRWTPDQLEHCEFVQRNTPIEISRICEFLSNF